MPENNNFTINWASYVVEILDIIMDIPVPCGEIRRIVITDLYNFATPMIRYDTGDLVAFAINPSGTKDFPMLKTVYGGSLDAITSTNCKIINPFVIFGNFYKFPEISQIQLIQKTKYDYTFLLNCSEQFKQMEEFLIFLNHF